MEIEQLERIKTCKRGRVLALGGSGIAELLTVIGNGGIVKRICFSKRDQTHVACGHNQKQAEQAAKQYAEKKREQMSEDFVLCFFCVFIRTGICFI